MVRAVGLLPALIWGVLAAFWRPRGPIFPFEALLMIAVSLLAGFVGGRIMRSRWTMVLAPVLFAIAGEVTRIGFTGPTVDFPHVSDLGLAALITGRGLYALITLLPMAVGAVFGAGSVRRSRSAWRWVGRFFAAIFAAAVLAVA